MKRIRNIIVSLALMTVSLGLTIAALEAYFRIFYDETDSLSASLSSRRWYQRHWNPINKMGFRDIEYNGMEFQDKKVLFIVGDSLAAGVGIKDHRSRFSDILREKLSDNWNTLLIARPGWDTEHQVKFLNEFQVDPDLVVLAYYINDIKGAAQLEGIYEQIVFSPPENSIIRFLLEHSHFFDYIFYRTGIFALYDSTISKFQLQLIDYYSHKKVWETHLADLLRMIDYCADRGANLVVLVFPHLSAVSQSAEVTSKVAAAFTERGIEAIDLTPRFENWKTSDLIVNRSDAHPSEKVHRDIAELLFPVIEQYQYTRDASRWEYKVGDLSRN